MHGDLSNESNARTCGEFLFFVRECLTREEMLDKSEYGNKVSHDYTLYTVKVDKSGKVG